MRFLKNSLLAALLFTIAIAETNAQSGIFSTKNRRNQYSTVGFGGGSSHYYGDLAPYRYFYYGIYTNVRWNGTINYTRYISQQTGVRFSFTYARLLGDDNTYAIKNLDKMNRNYLRNLHFRNDVKEFAITGIFNLLPQYNKGAQGRLKFMPYVFAGLGIIGHNPQAKAPDALGIKAWTSLKQYNTSGQLTTGGPKPYSLVQPVLPIGLGIKIKLNEKIDFMMEAGLRLTNTHYLDDVGNVNYADPSSLLVPYSKEFANRAGEDIAARTGNDRGAEYRNILTTYFSAPVSTGTTPSVDAVANPTGTPPVAGRIGYGTAIPNRFGTRHADSYIVTQFTLNYVIGNQVKCPTIN